MKTNIFFLFFSTISYLCSAQKVSIALNLQNGKNYYTNSSIFSTIDQTRNGQPINLDVSITVKTAYKVIKLSDTVYTMEVRYKKLSLKVKTIKGNASYSSVNAARNDATSQLLAALIDQPFLIRLSKTGKVISVANIEKMAGSLTQKIEGTDPVQREQLKGEVMKFFGEESFRERLQQTFAIYPSKNVSKNETWTIISHVQALGNAQTDISFQLTTIAAKYLLIQGNSNLISDKNKISQVDGLPVAYDLNGTLTSEIKVDKITGWVIEEKLNQDITGSYKIINIIKNPRDAIVPIKIKTIAATQN